jgi:hypothetical protein
MAFLVGVNCGRVGQSPPPGAPNELATRVAYLVWMEQVSVANSWRAALPSQGGGEAGASLGVTRLVRRLRLAFEGGRYALDEAGDVEAGESSGAGEAGGDVHR